MNVLGNALKSDPKLITSELNPDISQVRQTQFECQFELDSSDLEDIPLRTMFLVKFKKRIS
ncbi:unnamed protein product [Oppiella nova]|uniref:Uncharacterized protein n=1 Tax=Oppiella nova TaxID=334625 RepID=A0A7R9M254_9ACAR|nr:unnamed protein product [Oppiella nova]CAG2169383.1 unnamed protein product [Oppiella nova]